MTDASTTNPAFEAWLATPEGQAAANAPAPATTVTSTTEIPPPPAPVPDAAAPAAPAPVIDYAALAEALKAAGAVPSADAAPAAPAQAKDPVTENQFVKGSIVKHEWDDAYDGPSERYGIVVATYPDQGTGAASAIAWFDGPSGPIGDQYLTAV